MRDCHSSEIDFYITSNMEFFSVYTLFDISKTGVLKNYVSYIPPFVDGACQTVRNKEEWSRSRNQQRNFETLVQIISLRSQPIILENPKMLLNQNLINYNFGSKFVEKATVWLVSFATEHVSVYSKENNPVGALEYDSDNVPIIVGLKETVIFKNNVINIFGEYKNCYFTFDKKSCYRT